MCFLATVVTWHHWSKLQVVIFNLRFVVVDTPVLLAFLYCRAGERDGAFILPEYFVSFLLFLAASPPVPPLPSPALSYSAVLAGRWPAHLRCSRLRT